jgi:hypothetical protein
MRASKGSVRKARKFGAQRQEVKLSNPVAHHHPSFIMGNALKWECMAHDALIRENHDAALSLEPYGGLVDMRASGFADPAKAEKWREFRRLVAEHVPDKFVVEAGSKEGKTVVICGAGPSLRDTAAEWVPKGDDVWGCNSAAVWLHDNGHRVTHGFTVDQTPAMINEWENAPPAEYLIASSVHPHLTEHLQKLGHHVRFFHNFVGIQGDDMEWPNDKRDLIKMGREDWMYAVLYPGTVRAGSGLNATTRAIDVACYMGYEKIYVLGADCALRTTAPVPNGVPFGSFEHVAWLTNHTVMHADGGHALASGATAQTMTGIIDGREWTTKVDLMISAVWLTKMKRRLGDRLEFIGDVLPNALAHKSDRFLNRLPTLVDSSGKAIMVP